jgi:hypothetical protein
LESTNLKSFKEKELFAWLQDNLYSDLVKCKNPLSRWDCYSPEKFHRIELKCRKVHYDTLLLEKKKYDAMVTESLKHMDIPIYINSTPKGIFAFNLFKIEEEWEVNYLNPKNTYFGGSHRVPKEVTYLDINTAEVLWKI